MADKIKYKQHVWFLAILAFLLYSNTLEHGFVYDDFSVIKNNSIITKGIKSIPEIISTPYRHGFYVTSNDTYRPLSLIMFAIEYQLGNGSPFIFHLVNVILYSICVALFFAFLLKVLGMTNIDLAFATALLFAVHPIHTEVVVNIKSRDELLCFSLAMLCLIVYTQYIRSGKIKYIIAASSLYMLSLLSKETSVTFLAIIPLIFFFYCYENAKRSIVISISGIVVVSVYLIIRSAVLNTYNAHNISDVKFIDNFLVQSPSLASGLATIFFILGKYIGLLIVPYPLLCDYSFNSIPFVEFDNIFVLLSLATYISFFVFGVYRLYKHPRDPLAFGIIFFLVTIFLFSNILFFVGAAMAERFLFSPSAGFCLVVVFLVRKLVSDRRIQIGLIVSVSIIFTLLTFDRNEYWESNFILFQADSEMSPENARLNYYYANEILTSSKPNNANYLESTQQLYKAIYYLHRSLKIYPEYDEACKALGNAFVLTGNYDSAEYYYLKAIALNRNDQMTWNNLDITYYRAGKYSQSIEICKNILQQYPESIEKYKNIGMCYLQMADYDSAVHFFKIGASKAVDPLPYYQGLVLCYQQAKSVDSVKKYKTLIQQR